MEAKDNNMDEYHSIPNRKVCFDHNVVVTPIESRDSFTEAEIEQSWYSELEMDTMLDRCCQVANRLKSGQIKKWPLSSRGLEGFTIEGSESQADAFHACVDAVMDEQERQWETDCDDYERIAFASQQATRLSMIKAIERALQDEKDARKIYRIDQQKASPPTLPQRQVSVQNLTEDQSQDLSLYFTADEISSLMIHKHVNVDISNRGITRRMQGNRGPVSPMKFSMASAIRRAKAA